MKKLIYLLLLPLALAVAACGGKNGSSNKESVLARQDSVDAHGLQRMQSSKAETDIKFKGRDYHSLVSRTPDESLPHVSNEMGDTYVDNKIVLRITRGSENVLNKTFTKNDFSSVVDAKFLSKSILEGCCHFCIFLVVFFLLSLLCFVFLLMILLFYYFLVFYI